MDGEDKVLDNENEKTEGAESCGGLLGDVGEADTAGGGEVRSQFWQVRAAGWGGGGEGVRGRRGAEMRRGETRKWNARLRPRVL